MYLRYICVHGSIVYIYIYIYISIKLFYVVLESLICELMDFPSSFSLFLFFERRMRIFVIKRACETVVIFVQNLVRIDYVIFTSSRLWHRYKLFPGIVSVNVKTMFGVT